MPRFDILSAVFLSDKLKNYQEKSTMICLAMECDAEQEGLCIPTLKRIAKESGSSRSTAKKTVTELKKRGFMKMEQKKGSKSYRIFIDYTDLQGVVHTIDSYIPQPAYSTESYWQEIMDANRGDDDFDNGSPSIKTLAETTGLSPRSVRKHIQIAVDAGYLIRDERGGYTFPDCLP